ncbi:exosomal polycystin-1-interacting protein [Pleurodeles waltl]|uniref:exosomal polycystin-1-interacting protein n=1 Tax=Pleurodeles waltl TaxID=8319 RepID=UPI0037095CC9
MKMQALLDSSCILLPVFLGLCTRSSRVLGQQNSTLIFAADNNIRNCSCSSDIPDCEYNLAQLMCSCKTVLLHTVDRTIPRFSYSSDLTVWFKDAPTLGLLLNFSFVHDLKLSLCESAPLSTNYVPILGLRRLRIQSVAGARYTQQSLTIHNGLGKNSLNAFKALSTGTKTIYDIAYLDTALCNRFSSLKSYSVENVSNIEEHFPNLPHGNVFSVHNKTYTVTFIYC